MAAAAERVEWVGPPVEASFGDGALRMQATGAVLFTTLELRRPLLVHTAGTWPGASTPEAGAHRGSLRASLARGALWLLGR